MLENNFSLISDVVMLQKKYKNLKDTYRKVKSKKLPSGSGAKKGVKKWEYFDLCDQFMAPFVLIKP